MGEFPILLGTYKSSPLFAVLGTAGVILAAWYLLHAFRKVVQGRLDNPANFKENLPDLNWAEIGQLVPIVLLFFVIGWAPNIFLKKINPSASAVASLQIQAEDGEWVVDSQPESPLTADHHSQSAIH